MADLTKTRSDLVNRAATELGKLVSGQALETEDNATIDSLVDPLIEMLSADMVVTIDDSEAIDPRYFLPLARLLANEAAPSFGIPKSDQIEASDKMLLRRLTAAPATYETLRTTYF